MRTITATLLNTLAVAIAIAVAGCTNPSRRPAAQTDAVFSDLAGEFVDGYLAWRPLEAVSLGMHEYDGLLSDYSLASIEAEHRRLERYRDRFADVDVIL